MYRILLPLDQNTERTRRQAEYVASLPCASEEIHAILAHSLTKEQRSASVEMKRIERVDTIQAAEELLDEAGVDAEIRELFSPPSEAILEFAEDEDVDEIVVGGRKRSPAEKAILGSVTQTVILNADVPVTVVGTRQ